MSLWGEVAGVRGQAHALLHAGWALASVTDHHWRAKCSESSFELGRSTLEDRVGVGQQPLLACGGVDRPFIFEHLREVPSRFELARHIRLFHLRHTAHTADGGVLHTGRALHRSAGKELGLCAAHVSAGHGKMPEGARPICPPAGDALESSGRLVERLVCVEQRMRRRAHARRQKKGNRAQKKGKITNNKGAVPTLCQAPADVPKWDT